MFYDVQYVYVDNGNRMTPPRGYALVLPNGWFWCLTLLPLGRDPSTIITPRG